MENDLLQRGIAALKAGDKAEARRLLGRIIQKSPRDEQAWLWMSGAVDTAQERLTCLNKVLEINPHNGAAQRGLAALQKGPPIAPAASIETQPVPQPKPTLVQAVLGTALPAAEQIPTPNSASVAAMSYPYVKVSDMLDHSKSLDELDPEKREALEGFIPLIAQDLTVNHLKPEEIIDRISARGFSRKAVEQVVREIAQQPVRAPIRYERKLTKEQFESLPSPWLTMWINPRETMRRIVYYNPKQNVFLLATIDGFVTVLSQSLNQFTQLANLGLSDISYWSLVSLAIAIGACAILSPIISLSNLYLYGWFLHVTCRWLGGRAYPIETRAAIAWSAVPRLWGAILLPLKLVLVAYSLYTGIASSAVSADFAFIAMGILSLIDSVIAIWSAVVFMKCLGEVNVFSAWRALGAVFLCSLILGGAVTLSCCLVFVVLSVLGTPSAGLSGY